MVKCAVKNCVSRSEKDDKASGVTFHNHGKRSDKETQSPMLKIFKDMMQKDKRDPEKTNLLKDRHPERKRKHYSGSRSKSGHKTVSSSSDHPKKEPQYKRSEVEARNAHFDTSRSQRSVPFQSEKRESWWFWGSESQKGKGDDSCSCVSCAFKRLLSTDYACVLCVATIFIVSVAIAVLLVYKSVPCSVTTDERKARNSKMFYQKPESERLKRKINGLGKWSFGPKKEWRNIFARRSNDFDGFNFQGNDLASLVESENQLSKILDTDKLNDIQHSERLKDFYKKLVQTDAAIRNLRKSLNDNSNTNTNFDINNNNNFNFDSSVDFENDEIVSNSFIFPDRSKRSIKLHPNRIFHFKRREPSTQSKIDNGKLITKSTINMTANKKSKDDKNSRNKRFDNFTDGSFVIEKNKVVIQYKPNRKVAKCSHSPKDFKTHEAQLTHPFYKNTQRLDELLDLIMDKKIPDFLSDRSGFGAFFDKNKKCKHPQNEEIILVKDDDSMKDYDQEQKHLQDQSKDQSDDINNNNRKNFPTTDFRVETEKILRNKEKIDTTPDYGSTLVTPKVAKNAKDPRNIYANDFFEDSDGVEKKVERSMPKTTPSFDILLSISTLGNQPANKPSPHPTSDFPERPNMRKLQQVNMKDEDGVAYEDLKEVLADYKEGHDDEDKEADRKKRTDEVQSKIASMKNFPASVHNPNWKGPMPLYPEELTQMMKSDNIDDSNKNKDEKSQDYIEDSGNHMNTHDSHDKSHDSNDNSHSANDNAHDYKEVPVHNRDIAAEGDETKPRQTDVEYVEDYLDNGYEKLVELAQAYSDYGVLDEKKELDTEKKSDNNEDPKANKKRLGLSKRIRNNFKRGMKPNPVYKNTQKERSMPDYEGSEGIRIEIQPENRIDPLKNADAESYKTIKGLLHKHVKVVNDLKCVESMKNHDRIGPDIAIPRLEYKLPTTTKYKTTKTLNPLPGLIYKKRTLKTFSKGNIYEASTDKIINSNFENDKLEYKRAANESEDIDLDDEAKKLKIVNKYDQKSNLNEAVSNEENENESVENIFLDRESDGKFQFKRDTERVKEDNDQINKIVENSLLISQSMEKLKFKRDVNGTALEENEFQTNVSHNGTQIKRGIFNTLNSKQKKLDEKNVNIKVNGKTGNKPHVDNKNAPNSNSSSLSRFFTVLSNWFSALDEMEMAQNGSIITQRSDRALLSNMTNQSSSESQLTFPLYDSEMIENIGHRSRVLLSINDANSTKNDEVSNSDHDDDQNINKSSGIFDNIGHRSRILLSLEVSNSTRKDKVSTADDDDNQNANTPSSTELTTNNTLTTKATEGKPKGNANNTENHLVKRQAIDDSNLIFWNDLYDEEYGVNADPIENNIRDKHSADRSDFLKKSNTWIQDKVRMIADKFYPTDARKARKSAKDKLKGNKQVKRSVKYEDDEEGNTVKLDIATLTEKMKEVCKETVRAVQETKHIQVREENKEGQAASSLMQQLVRLMTDLVDFQVQERTCRKLPADLQRFLDWLTANKEEDTDNDDDLDSYTEKTTEEYDMSFGNKLDKSSEPDLLQPTEKESTDSKTDCLGTLQAVQNLIREYEEMSEDDKSLMTGVKTYLEDQMNFLQKQLTSFEDRQLQFNNSRYRRDIAKVGHTVAQTIDATAKNLDREFKNFKKTYRRYKGKAGSVYKQMLKTTAQFKDAVAGLLGKKVGKTTIKPGHKTKHTTPVKYHKSVVTNKKGKLHDHKENAHKHGFFHSKYNKNKLKSNAKLKDKMAAEENYKDENNVNKFQDFDDYNFNTRSKKAKDVSYYVDQPITEKDERNIKDVYFKAVEEAKKATLSKGSHMRVNDGDVFDKTDVFRINDYVGDKAKDS